MMSNTNFGCEMRSNSDASMEPITFRQNSVQQYEEEKLAPAPLSKTRSQNVGEKSTSDRFIPCRSYLESSHSLILSNVDYKPTKSFSSGSDTSREDTSSVKNYNALLENQFFGGDEALNEMNLS